MIESFTRLAALLRKCWHTRPSASACARAGTAARRRAAGAALAARRASRIEGVPLRKEWSQLDCELVTNDLNFVCPVSPPCMHEEEEDTKLDAMDAEGRIVRYTNVSLVV